MQFIWTKKLDFYAIQLRGGTSTLPPPVGLQIVLSGLGLLCTWLYVEIELIYLINVDL